RGNWEERIQEVRASALPRITADVSAVRGRDPGLLNSPQFSDLGATETDPDGTSDPILDAIRDLFAFDPSPLTLTTYYYGVNVDQTLYAFGKIGAGVRAAQVLRERYELDIREAEVDAARHALVALYDLALAEEERAVLAAERASRERQVQQASDFLDIGTGTRLNLLQAQAGLANLRPREIAAEGALDRARVTLNEALGRPPLSALRPAPGILDASSLDALPTLEALVTLGVAKPEIRGLAVEREALTLQEKATRADLLPEISFEGNYGIRTIFSDELFNQDFVAWDAGVYLTWNLFDGFATRSAARQIVSRRRQNELLAQARSAEVGRDIVSAALEYRRAREAISAAASAVFEATEALRVAEEESRFGAATPLEVLEAQRTLTEARFQEAQATHDALVSRADVFQLAGKIPGEALEVTP
ncbi:MAG: TolC family protein, partial [Acidobacteria bacterium]|nr:TolC family protein [Acidobacteriota bacterium]